MHKFQNKQRGTLWEMFQHRKYIYSKNKRNKKGKRIWVITKVLVQLNISHSSDNLKPNQPNRQINAIFFFFLLWKEKKHKAKQTEGVRCPRKENLQMKSEV